jgi:hypothetical protein
MPQQRHQQKKLQQLQLTYSQQQALKPLQLPALCVLLPTSRLTSLEATLWVGPVVQSKLIPQHLVHRQHPMPVTLTIAYHDLLMISTQHNTGMSGDQRDD